MVVNDRLHQNSGKERVGFCVSPPHPAGLLVNAIKPFKSKCLHPGGSTTNLAGKDIEGAANSHNEWDIQIVTMRCQKSLLAWRGHADEQAIGSTVPDLADDLGLLLRPEVAVSHSGKANCRMSFEHLLCRLMHRLACGPEKVRLESLSCAQRKQFGQQINPGYPLLYR